MVRISSEQRKHSQMLVIQTEAWMRDKLFQPVRVRPGEKAVAKEDSNYTDAKNYNPPKSMDFREGFWSIGCVLGPVRLGPTDIDHDCAESLFFGEKFLPHTNAVFGRGGKPRSHKLYLLKEREQPSIVFKDPITRSVIIELRADAAGGEKALHTVMPGSIHESGDIVAWSTHTLPDIAEVAADDLIHATRKVAMATLVVRHIWTRESGMRNEVNKCLAGMLYHFKWPLSEAEQFISAVMEYNGDNDKSRIQTLRATYSKGDKGAKIVGATTLKKELKATGADAAVERMIEWLGPTEPTVIAEFNEKFCCLSLEGKFRIADTDVRPGERPILMGKEDFLDLYGNQFTIGPDGKNASKARMWLGNSGRRFCRRIEFLPGVLEDALDKGVFNMWTGWAVQPDASGSCDAWLELVYSVICGKDDRMYDWFMNWMAQMVQHPTVKAHTCPVIIGVPGAGKTLMCTYLSRVLGAAYLQVTKPEHIQGRFNAHLPYTLLLHSDEALYARDKKHRAVIKSLVTDERQMSEQKGVDATFVRSWLRLLLTSNYDHAAPAEEKDRRFTIINMKDRKVDAKLRDRVLAEMNSTGPAALLNTLLTMKVDDHQANRNIKNEDWAQNVLDHTDPIVGWWHERLQTGLLVPEHLRWATRPSADSWPQKVGLEALYRYFVEDMRTSARQWGVVSKIVFSTKLNELTGGVRKKHMIQYYPPQDDDFPRWVRELPGAQKSILDMPPLKNCRYAFEKFMGHALEWEGTDIQIAEPEDGSEGGIPPPRY